MESSSVNIPALERNREKMEYYKNSEEERKKRIAHEQAKIDKERKETELLYEQFKRNEDNIKNLEIQYSNFLESVKSELLSNALCQIYGKCIESKYFNTEDSAKYGVSLINAYIKENTSYGVINNMKSINSIFLNNIVEAVEDTYKEILETTDKKNPDTFNVSDTTMDSFYDKLDFESFADAADIIKCRVSTSTEEFINAAKNDKDEIDQLMQDTKNRIDSASSEDIAQEATRMFTIKSNKIRNERKRNILEQMIFNTSEEIVKNQSLLESYTNSDNGKVDFDSIIEHVEIQYLVLEMLNTIKLENFNREKLQEIISV